MNPSNSSNPLNSARKLPADPRASIPRESIPALADNDYAYLNSGGSGPPTRDVVEAGRATDELCLGEAYLQGAAFFARQGEANDRARGAAARLVNADPGDLALTQNTTHGMNLGIFSIDWREGDEAISVSSEHPGCIAPLHEVEARFGAKLKLVDPPVTPEKIRAAMTPRTRMVALSHVDWTTGEELPLAEIAGIVREGGALTLVDGAQSVGNISVDIPATGTDLYAFTGHKWLLGPEGMGTLYVRPGSPVRSPNVGGASLADGFDYEGSYSQHPGARRFEASTTSPALAGGFAQAAEDAIRRGDAGPDGIRSRAELLMDMLDELPGVEIVSPRPVHSGLVSFTVSGVGSKEVADRLLEERLVVRFIPEPHPYVRASTHLFNTGEELEALTEAVGRLQTT
ncbi:aminotransferase class V-fold PLP-dependent enzyme [Rubrobacter aplysinae]|uniref:aminotransferase class V-fold PLP-dependent enzyme n=1 Tax=Rubrobacter aplysinae TaxID=909625 RepID=UPI00064BC948|nr:aminotransferase class V-fold PLP-dependent enzyme [Rubrobacter aplysinae]